MDESYEKYLMIRLGVLFFASLYMVYSVYTLSLAFWLLMNFLYLSKKKKPKIKFEHLRNCYFENVWSREQVNCSLISPMEGSINRAR